MILLVAGYLGQRSLFPVPDVEPIAPDASTPFAAAFSIENPSSLMTMHNLIWYCMMIPRDTSHQTPIVDLGQFQIGRKATEMAPRGREQHRCRETADIRRIGSFAISVSVDYDLVLEFMSVRRVVKRSFRRSDLTWVVEPTGGHWSH